MRIKPWTRRVPYEIRLLRADGTIAQRSGPWRHRSTAQELFRSYRAVYPESRLQLLQGTEILRDTAARADP